MFEVDVKSHPEMIIVGLGYCGKNEAGEIPQLWGKLMVRENEIGHRDRGVYAAYGISIMGPDYDETMVFDYIAGFAVTESPDELAAGMAKFTIPEGQYAAIKCPDLSRISQCYDEIYHWVKESPKYTFDISHGNFNFELYGEAFNPPAGSEIFYIYVPVKKK